ncbi:PQQ-binding-like beta-propeller repeat protein [Bacteroidota bacterium]
MNRLIIRRIFALSAILIFSPTHQMYAQNQENWTHFRGSDLSGIATGTYPVEWNDSTNVVWKTLIEGRGWSSPVVYGNQVWLTSASPDGKDMFVVCLDFESGEIIHTIDMFRPEKVYRKHAVNSYATPTSVIEKGYVYVHFGRYGTACINTESGEKVWDRTDMQCEHIQGAGSSLFLYENKLIVHMEGTDVQDIYALDKRSGNTIWVAKRDTELLDKIDDIGKKAYVTPIVMEVNGRKLLISNGSVACNAYDLETGEEVWFIPQGEDSTISMPVQYKGKVYFYTSFVTPEEGEKYCELWAVDPKGKGNLTENIIWRKSFPVLQLLTPVIYDDLLYTVDTWGILHCLDAANGETIWTHRMKGKYNSSPVVANELVYINSTRGETTVFKTGREYKEVAVNILPGEIWATPAFVSGSILMRTSEGLYKIN